MNNKLPDAVECFNKAIGIEPGFAKAHSRIGDCFVKQDKLDEAVDSYNKALSIQPDIIESLNNLGMVLQKKGKIADSIKYFLKVLEIEPNNLGAHNNLGNALLAQGKQVEAVEYFKKANSIKPDDAGTLNNLGNGLQSIGKLTEAFECYNKAVATKQDFPETFNNLGNLLNQMGKPDEAAEHYHQALTLRPNYPTAHSNYLLMLNYLPNITSKEIYEESLKWDKQQTAGLARKELHTKKTGPQKSRLNIGYVSPDFRHHSVAYFFEPLLKAHNRENFTTYCYSNVNHPDVVTKRLQSEADHWVSIVGMNDDDAADMIRNDKIDILVDLTGHTGNNRLVLFAYKPAPIQVTWLGYPNTTGMSAIDYRFTDEITDPIGAADKLYSEKLIRLENGFLCYQPYDLAPEVSRLPCLNKGNTTFGSFNNLVKLNSEVIKIWSEILQAVPDSQIILKGSTGNPDIKTHLTDLFYKYGISRERVIFYDRLPKQEDHLALYNKVDIALDPFPYNGTTTSFEALWMGVPVVTMLGDRHSGRVGASIMHHLGLQDLLVAKSPEDYIEKAVDLTGDLDILTEVRNGLRSELLNSPLCDAAGFTKKVEQAYVSMWEEYVSKL